MADGKWLTGRFSRWPAEAGRLDPEVPKALGLELQLMDDERVADAKASGTHGTGAMDLIAAPTAKSPPLAIRQWHMARVVVRRSHVEHWLDGVKFLDADLEPAALRNAMAAQTRAGIPKLSHPDEPRADPSTKYPLVPAHHGGNAWFRNMRVRELE